MTDEGASMALTKDDLGQIQEVVNNAVSGLPTRNEMQVAIADAVSGLATKADLDRMETRIVTSMNLLERDAFARLADHERRIAKLEHSRV